MAKSVYSACVIGLGRIGFSVEAEPARPKPATHLGAWDGTSRTFVAGICDVDQGKVKAASRWLGGLGNFDRDPAIDPAIYEGTDAGEMLIRVKPDIVSIATPPEDHRDLVELAAALGVPAIVCEKPMALSVRDCLAMVEACKKFGSLLFVNHSRRFDPELRSAAHVCNERIGAITHVEATMTDGLWNSGPHMIDLIRMFVGELDWVLYSDGVFAAFQTQSGATVSLHMPDVPYSVFQVSFMGEKGGFMIGESGFAQGWLEVQPNPFFEGYKSLRVAGDTDFALRGRSFMAPMAAHVVEVLDGRAEPISTGQDGLEVVRVLEALGGTGSGTKRIR